MFCRSEIIFPLPPALWKRFEPPPPGSTTDPLRKILDRQTFSLLRQPNLPRGAKLEVEG